MIQKKKTKQYNRSTELRKADAAFSKFIRTRDSQHFQGRAFRCISCGEIKPIDQADNGHYVNRQHMSLRFSERNCHAQCRRCNRFDEGNMQGYRKGLVRLYGETQVTILEAMKYETNKLDAFDLHYIAEQYRKKVKEFEYQIK